ncbi:hypothetical protein AAVH_19791 [Aphelenchoides avenae]|nr:hypothetical protein AAVH_19791 [Aphelenchus avenae]
MEGTGTTIALWTTDYRPITIDAIALETIAPQVTTAVVETTDLPLLYLGFLPIRPLRVQPDIIIGQDLIHLFDRQAQPNLPHGFYVVKTNIGTTIGGAGQPSAASACGPFRRLPLGSPALCRSGPQVQETPRPLPEDSSFDHTVETHHNQEIPVPTESDTLSRHQS